MASGISELPLPLQNKRYEVGELIVTAAPYAHVISMKFNGEHCDWCAMTPNDKTKAKLFKCGACKYEHYCNKSCQKKAWAYHKFECPLLKARLPKVPSDSARLLTKLVYNVKRGVTRPKQDPGWREFSDLCHHSNTIKADEARAKQFMELSYTLGNYLGQKYTAEFIQNTSELLEIFGRMVFNGFTIMNMCHEAGAAVYISPSVFNHSCKPNAVFVCDGTTLNVRAVKPIDTTIEPITVNYFDPMTPLYSRLKEIKEFYFFDCKCQKCSDLEGEAFNLATICPTCKGNVVQRYDDLVCLSCFKVVDDDVYQLKRQNAFTKAEDLCKATSKHENLDALNKFIKDNEILSEDNVHVIKIKTNIYADESRIGDTAAAYELGEWLLPRFVHHYEEYFPAVGEHHFKQARLAWYLHRFPEAINHYTEALRILRVTHGPQHHFVQLCSEDLAECRGNQMMTEIMTKQTITE